MSTKQKYSSNSPFRRQELAVMAVFAILLCSKLTFGGGSNALTVARSALRDGLNDIAVRNAETAVEKSAEKDKARLVLLEALAKENEYSKIIERIEEWGFQNNDTARYWNAWARFGLEDYNGALDILKNDFSDSKLTILSDRLKARAYSRLGNIDAADAVYEKVQKSAISNDTLFAEAVYERARMLGGADRKGRALEILSDERVNKLQGETGDSILFYAAGLAEDTGDAEKADAIRRRIFARGDAVAESVFVPTACAISTTLWNANKKDEAIDIATRAVKRAVSRKMQMYAGYNLAYRELAVPDLHSNGVARIRALVRGNLNAPESCRAQIVLADALLRVGNAAEADKEYKFALDSFPQLAMDEHAVEGRAWAMFKLGKNTEAVALFARAAQISTNEIVRARCYYKEGDALLANGLYENAAQAYDRIKDGPFLGPAKFNRADALVRAGKTKEAYSLFTELGKDSSITPSIRINAALRAAQMDAASGRFETAISGFSKILTPQNSASSTSAEIRRQALDGRGRAYYRSYRYREAAQDFETIAAEYPKEENEMRFFTALCRYGEGKNAEARKMAQDLLARSLSENLRADIVLWMAKFDYSQGDYKKARKGFEIFAKAYPSSERAPEALVSAARAAAAENDFTDVVEIVKTVANKYPSSSELLAEACVLQGEALMELARFDEAVLTLERAERSTANNTLRNRAIMLKADCLFAMGADFDNRYREALNAYRTLLKDTKLSPSIRLAVSFKTGRTLEKLGRFDEAVDQYYSEVVIAYIEARKRNEWFDENARAFFTRAGFSLADYYEAGGEPKLSANILRLVADSGVPAADEAERRLKKLGEKMKGGF